MWRFEGAEAEDDGGGEGNDGGEAVNNDGEAEERTGEEEGGEDMGDTLVLLLSFLFGISTSSWSISSMSCVMESVCGRERLGMARVPLRDFLLASGCILSSTLSSC